MCVCWVYMHIIMYESSLNGESSLCELPSISGMSVTVCTAVY